MIFSSRQIPGNEVAIQRVQDGLVRREVFPTVPPRVDYALTPLGASFFERIEMLAQWASDHHDEVRAARQAYVAPAANAPL